MNHNTYPAQSTGIVDPSMVAGNVQRQNMEIFHTNFASVEAAPKKFSDEFIDNALTDNFQVGGEKVITVKGFLDQIEPDATDAEVLNDPDRVAGLYESTSRMVGRNLKLRRKQHPDPTIDQQRLGELKSAKAGYLAHLDQEIPVASQQIKAFAEGSSRNYPVEAVEYRGFAVDGKNILSFGSEGVDDVEPNIKIQDQATGTFIVGYSDKQVEAKMLGQKESIDKRIYLNPQVEATPEIFEKLLQVANQQGISLQLKMFQRASEFATTSAKMAKGNAPGGLRGDGIVIGFNEAIKDDVLSLVLAIAQDEPEAFIGRKTARLPAKVAEGIAAADESGVAGVSATAHRSELLSLVTRATKEKGLGTQESRDYFRRLLAASAAKNGINPDNIAFNTAA